MIKKISAFWKVAFQTLRSNPGHTLLSTLGIVIGVAALVSILSLGDGMERYGRDQILNTTDLQEIKIMPQTWDEVDGIRIPRKERTLLEDNQIERLYRQVDHMASLRVSNSANDRIHSKEDTFFSGSIIYGLHFLGPLGIPDARIIQGSFYESRDSQEVIVLGSRLMELLHFDSVQVIGSKVSLAEKIFSVVGVVRQDERDSRPRAWIPLNVWRKIYPSESPDAVTVVGNAIEWVNPIKDSIKAHLDLTLGDNARNIRLVTNEGRLAQIEEGMFFFKLIMGLIVGLSVLVGGIGVMNVLLMSVSERTREIGIRKAIGATRKDISLQFLLESLSLSLVGSFLGLILGIGLVFTLTPIIRNISEVPFYAALSMGTVLIIAGIALCVGILFGTYPAWKASKLTPVDAIRHE